MNEWMRTRETLQSFVLPHNNVIIGGPVVVVAVVLGGVGVGVGIVVVDGGCGFPAVLAGLFHLNGQETLGGFIGSGVITLHLVVAAAVPASL